MAQSSTTLHEAVETLSPEIVDRHRAIVSLMEELEAVDWYAQRAAAATDPALREIIAHNRDEEKEHAMMLLEWLRRSDTKFAEVIATYVNSSGSIVGAEEATKEGGAAKGAAAGSASDGSLGIGSLRGGN
jgi:ferritin-like protein